MSSLQLQHGPELGFWIILEILSLVEGQRCSPEQQVNVNTGGSHGERMAQTSNVRRDPIDSEEFKPTKWRKLGVDEAVILPESPPLLPEKEDQNLRIIRCVGITKMSFCLENSLGSIHNFGPSTMVRNMAPSCFSAAAGLM